LVFVLEIDTSKAACTCTASARVRIMLINVEDASLVLDELLEAVVWTWLEGVEDDVVDVMEFFFMMERYGVVKTGLGCFSICEL